MTMIYVEMFIVCGQCGAMLWTVFLWGKQGKKERNPRAVGCAQGMLSMQYYLNDHYVNGSSPCSFRALAVVRMAVQNYLVIRESAELIPLVTSLLQPQFS